MSLVEMRSSWVRVVPKSNMTAVLLRRGGTQRHGVDTEKKAKQRQRQRMVLLGHKPRKGMNPQRPLEARREEGFFPRAPGGARPC